MLSKEGVGEVEVWPAHYVTVRFTAPDGSSHEAVDYSGTVHDRLWRLLGADTPEEAVEAMRDGDRG